VTSAPNADLVLVLVAAPAVASLLLGRNFVKEARLEHGRSELERRAQEVLVQDELAPKRWAERLAPDDLPQIEGFELGRVYQAGSGLMAGDFYDVMRISKTRIAAVIGDVSGHGIDPAITAFQAKYLLRVFLRQYRDPAQALEELNTQMSAMGRNEEFISLCVVVFDTKAGTLRFASAGHPAVWIWHEREVSPLRATGPLLMLDPKATYISRELRLDTNDLCLLYTDGLAEARSGDQLFGEDRVASQLRRDPGVTPDVLCKSLLEAARDFSSGPITDDVAILAIRRT
jgi:serine phosphatase RsbU (regulator of sigma subunit)